ncbi:MAG: TRAP transporter TatT component family protein [Myxococcales bacterium]|nr:TRAP transporter TatT component family protein [Myxococcales bacterium]
MTAPTFRTIPAAAAFLALCTLLGGCNLQALLIRGTVDSTAEFTEEKGTAFADPELLGPILAGSTVTSEGLLYFVDDYEPLLMGTIFSNVAYGVGWLLAESHQAEIDGEFDKAEQINLRAGLLFARALYHAKRMLRLRDDDFDAAVAGGVDVFQDWVDENFYEKDDAEVLLTAGMAYLVSMIESEEGLAAAVDLPYARYMIERSIELDRELNGGTGLMLIGVMECTMPEMLGGRPRVGLKLMEQAAAIEDRQNHGVLVSMAERCAVALQDRKMFHSLLMEVIEAGDNEEYRLPNKLARHQAERLLQQIDEFFYD